MKKQSLLTCSALTVYSFLAMTSNMAALSAVSSIDDDLPGQIYEHYNTYNYISLFSSDVERELIADSLMCEGTLERSPNAIIDFCHEIPDLPDSQRLDKIRTLIVNLSDDVMRDRNSLSSQTYLLGEGALLRTISPDMQPYTRNPYAPLSELLEISQISVDNNLITVAVTVYSLEPSTNTTLISQYDAYGSRGENIPSTDNLIQLAAPSSILRREVHQWIVDDGDWKRSEMSTILLTSSL